MTCEATDEAGTSAAKQFTVEGLGAADQLDLLLIDATGVGTGTSLADKVKDVQTAVDAGRTRNACTGLAQFLDMVTKQAAKGKLTSARAASLTAQANTIKATLKLLAGTTHKDVVNGWRGNVRPLLRFAVRQDRKPQEGPDGRSRETDYAAVRRGWSTAGAAR